MPATRATPRIPPAQPGVISSHGAQRGAGSGQGKSASRKAGGVHRPSATSRSTQCSGACPRCFAAASTSAMTTQRLAGVPLHRSRRVMRGNLLRKVLADVHGRGGIGAQSAPRPPPSAVEEESGMPPQTDDFGDIGVGAIDLRGPRAGTDDPARLPEPAMKDLEQRAQHDHVADSAEPDDDRIGGGLRHGTGRFRRGRRLISSGAAPSCAAV